jgi:hypothetical protein
MGGDGARHPSLGFQLAMELACWAAETFPMGGDVALVIIDLADAHSFSHPVSLAAPCRPAQLTNGASRHYGIEVL